MPCPDFQYPAAVSVVLGGAKLIDDSHDERSFRSKILLALHGANIRKAENEIRDVGLPPLEVLIRQQHKREQDRGRELAYYSQTTEEVYSKVLSHTAELADAPMNSDALAKVGLHLGRVAYLLDSYADYPEDISVGRFNLLRALSPKAPASLMTNPKRLLTHHSTRSLHVIREAMKNVKLRRFRDIITHVVTDGLEAKVQRVMMGLESPLSRPIAYLVAPLTILTALRLFTPLAYGQGGSDYCLSAAGTHVAEGAAGAFIGGVGGALISSKIGSAPSTHPRQEERGIGERDLFPAFQRYKAHTLMQDAPIEDERKRRGLTFLQQEEDIMKERPDFMRRFDRDITSQYRRHIQSHAGEGEYYHPGDEGHPTATEWALTRDEYKHLPEDEKRQYREWRRRYDACRRNQERYSPYPKDDSGYQGRGYGRKEFSSTEGSRG